MTNLYAIGIEGNSLEDVHSTSGTVAIDATSKITGVYSVLIDSANGNSYIVLNALKSGGSGGDNEHYLHFKFLSSNLANTPYLARGYDDGASADVWRLDIVDVGGSKYLRINVVAGSNEFATGATALSANTVYRVEVHWIRSNGSSKAFAEVKLDGVAEVSKEHSTTAGQTAEKVHLGYLTKIGGTSANLYLDDIWLNDTAGSYNNGWPGNLTFLYKRPAGEGTYDAWLGVGDTANQYLNWDETVSDSDTTHNRSQSDFTDVAQTSTLSATATGKTIRVVKVAGQMRRGTSTASAPTTPKVLLRDGSTDLERAVDPALTTSYAYKFQYEETRPAGGPWTNAAVNGLEIGTKYYGSSSGSIYKLPTGDVAADKWTTGVADNTNHYANVDDAVGAPDSDTSYITTSINGDLAGFTYAAYTARESFPAAVQVNVYARSISGTVGISGYITIGGTKYYAASQNFGTTYPAGAAVFSWETNPATGLAWDWTGVLTIQNFGARSDDAGEKRVTSIFIGVYEYPIFLASQIYALVVHDDTTEVIAAVNRLYQINQAVNRSNTY